MNLSSLYAKARKRIHEYGLLDTTRLAFHIAHGLSDYYLNPTALRTGKLPAADSEMICKEMLKAGLEVLPYQINLPAFLRWLDYADFPDFYVRLYGNAFKEKALEHYIGAELLGMSKESVLIDVAASESPWMNIAPRLYGVTAIALDLKAPSFFVSGNKVVADATLLPFPDESIDSMALHCAYEMFEGESDSLLIPEAARALRKGGRLVILPLYMHHLYYVDSSPGADRRNIDYQGAKRVWREERDQKMRLGGIRFSRKYDVPAFVNRVVRFKGAMNLKIWYVQNEKEVDPTCYLKFAAVFEK
jgi:SAM-dependent methyltransferase